MSLTINGSTNTITGVNGLNIAADTSIVGSSALGTTENTHTHSLKGATTILANSSSPALKITQSGTGSALLVEDATSDSSPFLVTLDGTGVFGHTAPWSAASEKLQVVGAGVAIGRFSFDTSAYSLNLIKSRNTTPGSHTVVSSGDTLGSIDFYGDDGTTYVKAASIKASVDGTPGTNDMPGKVSILTSPDGSITPVERFSIDNTGLITHTGETKLVSSHNSVAALHITQTGTGNAILIEDSTSVDSSPFVVDASGRLILGYTSNMDNTSVQLYNGIYSTITYENSNSSNSYITIKKSRSTNPAAYSLVQASDLIGGIFFYGDDGTAFRQAASITSYIDGTAAANDMPGRLLFSTSLDGTSTPTERMRIDNSGCVGIGTTAISGYNIRTAKNLTGATSVYAITIESTIQADVTTQAICYLSQPSTLASAFTLPTLTHFYAVQGTIGASSTVTAQYGFLAAASLIGAGSNFGFYGNIPAGTNRYNFYANGTAPNYFGGSIGVGSLPVANSNIYIDKQITGASSAYGLYIAGQVQSGTVTGEAHYVYTLASNSSGTTSNLYHYRTAQGTFTGTVSNQYGFLAAASLVGATNNFGFYGNIPAGTNRYNFYAAGTADNVFAGNSAFGKIAVPTTSVDATSVATKLVTNSAGTYTVLTTDYTIIQTTAASVYTLPSAASFTGRLLHLVTQFAGTVTSASSNVVPLAGGAAGTAILAATAGKFATLQSNGTSWIIIAAN